MHLFASIVPMLAVMLLACGSAFSQNTLPARVQLVSGETLEGQVRTGNWAATPQSFDFLQASSATRKLRPRDTKTCTVTRADGKEIVFKRLAVRLDEASPDLDKLDYRATPNFADTVIFAEVLVESQASLLSFVEKTNGKPHFFVEKDSVETLVYRKFLFTDAQGSEQVRDNNRFRQQLLRLMADCPDVAGDIQKATFQAKSLARVFEKYAACKNQGVRFAQKTEKTRLDYGPLLGLSYTRMRVSGSSTEAQVLNEAGDKASAGPVVGLRVNWFLPRTNERFAWTNDLFWHSLRYSAAVETKDIATRLFTLEAKASWLSLQSMGRFYVRRERPKVFVAVGNSVEFLVSYQDRFQQLTTNFTPPKVEQDKMLFDGGRKALFINFVGGLGLKTGPIGLELRYFKTAGLTPFANLASPTRILALLASWEF